MISLQNLLDNEKGHEVRRRGKSLLRPLLT